MNKVAKCCTLFDDSLIIVLFQLRINERIEYNKSIHTTFLFIQCWKCVCGYCCCCCCCCCCCYCMHSFFRFTSSILAITTSTQVNALTEPSNLMFCYFLISFTFIRDILKQHFFPLVFILLLFFFRCISQVVLL